MREGEASGGRWYFARAVHYSVFGVLAAALLLLSYVAGSIWQQQAITTKLVNQYPHQLACHLSDSGYCSLMRQLVSAMTVGDYSLLLANQVPAMITCTPPSLETLCKGVQNTVAVRTFTIYQNGAAHNYLRNDYIALFDSLVAHSGALYYRGDNIIGTQADLVFQDSTKVVTVTLRLEDGDSSWRFLWPAITK